MGPAAGAGAGLVRARFGAGPAATVREHGGERSKVKRMRSDPSRVGWERQGSGITMGGGRQRRR